MDVESNAFRPQMGEETRFHLSIHLDSRLVWNGLV